MMKEKIKPKKSLGQNFLIDRNIAKKIVDLVEVSNEDLLIEIGPGQGVLTRFFCDKPINLIAVEIDIRYVEQLQQTFQAHKNISIIHHDFLTYDFSQINEPRGKLKWLGNLPYNITSSVLFKLLSIFPAVKKAVFMVQQEVANRINAASGNKEYGIPSILIQTFYKVSKEFNVSNKVFRPKPKVDSAVISLDIRPDFDLNCNMLFFQRIVKTAFNQRRKLLSNALEPIMDKSGMEQISFNFNRRPEQIPVNEWKDLCVQLEKKKTLIRQRSG